MPIIDCNILSLRHSNNYYYSVNRFESLDFYKSETFRCKTRNLIYANVLRFRFGAYKETANDFALSLKSAL